jgi:lysophospholipase L1-like esterase
MAELPAPTTDASSTARPIGRRLKRWGLGLFVGLLVLAVGVELFARFGLGLGDPPLTVTHPTIEYLFKPNQDCQRFGNRILINQYGMRSEPFPPEKSSPDELRILVFGDSIINGGNLTDHEELATTLLQRRLAEELDRPVVVGNVSAVSWGPGNHLAWQEEYGWLDADAVLLVLSAQDAADVPTFAPLDRTFLPAEKPWLASWEGFTRYFLPRFFPSPSEVVLHSKASGVGPEIENASPAAKRAQVQQQLTAFIQRAVEAGLPVSVVLWWYPGNPDLGIAPADAAAGQALLESAEDAGTTDTLNLTMVLQERTAGINLYRDGLHPNARGQWRLAEAIVNFSYYSAN